VVGAVVTITDTIIIDDELPKGQLTGTHCVEAQRKAGVRGTSASLRTLICYPHSLL
jgi:hypothetical protein